jgi:kanamycin kinase
VLAELAPGWSATLAYGLIPTLSTWRLEHPDGRVRFAKVDLQPDRFPTLPGEAERMIWAAPYLPVPVVLEVLEHDGIAVLLTEALPGRNGTDPAWGHDLAALVGALGRGLAAFHAAVSEEWCPFPFDIGVGLEHVRGRVARDEITVEGFHAEHQHLATPAAALAALESMAPSSEDVVVCHGDYCPPNELLTDGVVTGYVDLGQLGVGDRWRDIAIGGWSAVWNFGVEYEPLFYAAYGVEPDHERIGFYRLLWELTS